jgi:hypothetical protein
MFTVALNVEGYSLSGTMNANINCPVERNENNITLSLELTPTNATGSLQQLIAVGGPNPVFNFVGTVTDMQVQAGSQGTIGADGVYVTYDMTLTGTIEQNSFRFTIASASEAELSISTPQQITLQPNK